MPLEIEPFSSLSGPQRGAPRHGLVIGLINNMPDTALETTEGQFARLLGAAAGSLPVRLRLSSLPEVPRGNAGRERIDSGAYWPVGPLLQQPLDALIVTGAEPVAPRLSDEPYWDHLGRLLEWADANTYSSVWSCLAAHAAVAHLDGIQRRRLQQKRCGVYAHEIEPGHMLMKGIGAPVRTPHSRWNELPVDALQKAGYVLASSSPANGADAFTKQKRSLLVFFQGHPEYEDTTLMKEYRRDVGRFLRGQQAHYPTLPHDYFSPAALATLQAFEARARAARAPELLDEFPSSAIMADLSNTWGLGASRIYRNWLTLLATAARANDPSLPPHELSDSPL
jgi:homoserine O-succinyltransferase